MTTLADLRARLRIDLDDTAGERWDDAALDRHLQHAVSDISLAAPRRARVTVPTAPGSREVDVRGIGGLLGIDRAEYPAGLEPPGWVEFEQLDGAVLLVSGPVPDGRDAAFWCRLAHVVDAGGSTLGPRLEELAVLGAAAFAAFEAASGTLERVTLNPATAERYAALGRARETAFRQLLREAAGRGRVRSLRARLPGT
ncbi:hypothetical protein [Tepidiforma sp.]|uniref:phage adaptor protein n=1 Tax=Tepidiforma sp. TaxID=2682230 RepID=UPI002ADE6244|nr:hypothetical protein [Tepidiforma sp.]